MLVEEYDQRNLFCCDAAARKCDGWRDKATARIRSWMPFDLLVPLVDHVEAVPSTRN